ncbi:hypothetical protein Dimus_035561 [Dionaea muscipula]
MLACLFLDFMLCPFLNSAAAFAMRSYLLRSCHVRHMLHDGRVASCCAWDSEMMDCLWANYGGPPAAAIDARMGSDWWWRVLCMRVSVVGVMVVTRFMVRLLLVEFMEFELMELRSCW